MKPNSSQRGNKFTFAALRIVLAYLTIGLLWILVSDTLLHAIVNNPELEQELQLLKGTFFVLTTSAILYWLIQRGLSTLAAQENALIASESRYRTLVEQASDGIFIADAGGNLVETNSRGCEMLGYTRDELLRLNITDVLAPGEVEKGQNDIPRLQAGATVLSERLMKRKVGSVFPTEINTRLLSDGSFQGIARDITERKSAEQELVASELRYRTLVETMNEGITRVDLDDRIEYVNNKLCEMLGYERHELVGQIRRDLLVDEANKEIITTQTRLRLQDIADRYELRMKKKSGELIWVAISGAPAHDAEGNVVGSIGIHSNITQRKLDQQRLFEYAQSQTELLGQVLTAQEAERRRLQMDIHDGPLQSLAVSLLSMDRALKQFSRGAHDQGQEELQSLRDNLIGIVNDLRGVLSDLSLDIVTTQGLGSALRDHTQRFSDLTSIPVALHDTLQERLPSHVEMLLYRLAQESLSNIRKHSGATLAEISVDMEDGYALMTVTDNGKGFDVEKSLAHRQPGTGIGLHSMRKRINDAHGTLSIESDSSKGTKLVFRCPVLAEDVMRNM